jgi:hypothetical protein
MEKTAARELSLLLPSRSSGGAVATAFHGSLLGSVPAGVTAERLNTGLYVVTFNRPVAGCLISAAVGSSDGNAPRGGGANTIPYTQGNPNQLVVITYNGAAAYEDRDFYVQMVCP